MNVHIACIVLKRGGEPVKVDSDIEVHELAEDNRIVYMKNGNLYFSDLKSTSRIGQNITTFYLNKEKNKVAPRFIKRPLGGTFFYFRKGEEND